jgi:ATP adenylyltransferase/5',5'''-P-1,P-4-tetraphosphate phosphorylase II
MINKLYLVHQVSQAWMLNCNIYGVVDIFYLILVHEFKDDVKIIHISMFVKFCQILGMSYQENPMNLFSKKKKKKKTP